jgi:hypothetical protein
VVRCMQVGAYAAGLPRDSELASRPLDGIRIGLIEETMGAGVSDSVRDVVEAAARHMEGLGACVERVSMKAFASGLPAYYIIASSEASSNLSRCDQRHRATGQLCCLAPMHVQLPINYLHPPSMPRSICLCSFSVCRFVCNASTLSI